MGIQFKQTLKIFTVLLGVLLFGVLLGVSLVNIGYISKGESNADSVNNTHARQEEILVSLAIDYGNGDTQAFPREVLQNTNTVFDLLGSLEQKGELTLQKRNFPGMGVFIEAINGVHNSNNYYWQYWVNGEYARVAAELYELKGGDSVLWKRTNEISQ